ncbi:MAG: hypothetical protein BWX88_03033 [Planctomycetes bacterium ADurb.Bin126]|nr:MAG: hypothetical protein BWX88_03033 [Planctomycetes bacterium ADurb.Bin126]HOD84890.1 DUF1080 domain-containing protein [Phycisphaerae bacterium]HQL75315.1 DUF1080 domain-containing protein [Phycisphaerae bacterium]
MNKTIVLTAALCLAVVPAWAADHPDSSKWDDLFSKDFSDAIVPADKGKPIWTWENGELTASVDQAIWTKEQIGDCVIDLEFKCGPAANSGVIVYTSDLKNWIPNSVEVQILDDNDPKWAKVDKTWLCGGIFGHLAPAQQVVKKAGEWNRMTVTCKGPVITVLLNGVETARMDMTKWTSAKKNPDGSAIPPWLSKPKAEIKTQGHIGLQGKHGGAPIFFRNMKIKKG